MEWTLENVNDFGKLKSVTISPSGLRGYYLYIYYSWESGTKAYDDYNFKTDSNAKSYFAKNWKSTNGNKPKWIKS